MDIKDALSVLMLCTPVFIFASDSSALLGRPRCGLSICLSLLAIFSTPFWVYANICHEKTDKTRECSKAVHPCLTAIHLSLIFVFFNSACVWPTALKLGCVINIDMLFLVMGFISLIDKILCLTVVNTCHYLRSYSLDLVYDWSSAWWPYISDTNHCLNGE